MRKLMWLEEYALLNAHKKSFWNRKELEKYKNADKFGKAGCFSCLKVFDISEIGEWADLHETAICPYCHVDSVLGASDHPIYNKDFLVAMKEYWFRKSSKKEKLPFETDPNKIPYLIQISQAMLVYPFASDWLELAKKCAGTAELGELWYEEIGEEERLRLILEIQKIVGESKMV